MATMNISLPDPLREFVEDEVERRGYATVSEYMRDLVRHAKDEKNLEERLLAALDSKDLGEVGTEFFDRLKRRAREAVKRGA